MAQPIKYYMDEHVPVAVTEGLRRRGVDVLTTQQAGMCSATDEQQLAFAISAGRVIFTQDSDFLRLHALGKVHAGVIFGRQQMPVRETIRGLLVIHELLDFEDMAGHVEFL